MHQNREWFAAHAHGPLGAVVRALYGALGAPLPAPANLSAYQLRQWGVTGDPDANGTLRVRASILNTAAQLQPYPLLRVTLADRFGKNIGRRDFEPGEYLGKPTAKLLAPGERVDATLDDFGSGQKRRRVRNRRMPARRRSKSFVRQRCCAAGQAMTLPNNGPSRSAPTSCRPIVLLAPMAGVTDRPFRILCRRFGAGLAASEMLSADVRLWDTPKSRRRMDHTGEPSPRVVQIAGFDPSMMAEAARRNVDAGAQIIDINMGCPAKKVCNRLAGSALLQDEELVARILHSVVRAVEVPVTLKTRTGWDRDHKNGVRIARIAEDNGIQALAIHGRTRADHVSGKCRTRNRGRHQGRDQDSGVCERRY